MLGGTADHHLHKMFIKTDILQRILTLTVIFADDTESSEVQ